MIKTIPKPIMMICKSLFLMADWYHMLHLVCRKHCIATVVCTSHPMHRHVMVCFGAHQKNADTTYFLLILPSDADWTIRPGLSLGIRWTIVMTIYGITTTQPWTTYRIILALIGGLAAWRFGIFGIWYFEIWLYILLIGSMIWLLVPWISERLTCSSAQKIIGNIIAFPYDCLRHLIHTPWTQALSFDLWDNRSIWTKRAIWWWILTLLLLIIIPLLRNNPWFAYILDTYVWLPLVELFRTIPVAAFTQIAVLTAMGIGIILAALHNKHLTIPSSSAEPSSSPKRTVDDSIMAIVIWWLVLVYLLYLGVEIRYFFGWTHELLTTLSMTYAEYAHQWFIELIIVCIFNLGMVRFVWTYNPHASWITKAWTTVLLASTIFLCVSSGRRTWQYIASYGSTHDRVLVFFGIWLIIGRSTLACISLYRRCFAALQSGLIFSLASFFVLVYSNVDYRLAWANVELHPQMETRWFRKSTSFDYTYLLSLSDDALPIKIRAYQAWLIPASTPLDALIDPYGPHPSTPRLYQSLNTLRAHRWINSHE